MNDPVVSPWLVYLITRVDNVIGVASLLAIVGFIGWIATNGIILEGKLSTDESRGTFWMRQMARIWFIALPLTILTPSKSDLIAMIVALKITPNAISAVVDAGKRLKDEIKADVIELLRGEPEKK